MNARQSLTISTLIFGFIISTAYAQGTNTINSSTQTTPSATVTTTTASADEKPATFKIGETWQEHLQKEMDKQAAEEKAQGQGH